MKKPIVLKHEFVEFIPVELKEGIIYVSMRFGTASHLCVCGCGNKVVTPLRPTDWKLIYDGKTISLHPSIGNWSFPYRSHYVIRNNQAHWVRMLSKEEVAAGRAYERRAKEIYFRETKDTVLPKPVQKPGFWRKLKNKLWKQETNAKSDDHTS
jgi:hypothetical protein